MDRFSGTVQKRVPDRRFSAEEMELIASLGDRLGYLDREMQLRQLDIFEEELCRRLDFLACQLPEKRNYAGIWGSWEGFSGSAFVVGRKLCRAWERRTIWKSVLFLK